MNILNEDIWDKPGQIYQPLKNKEKITESLLSNAKKYFGTLPINE